MSDDLNIDYVNLSVYPLHEPTDIRYRSLVEELGNKLVATGLLTLPDFLTPAGIDAFNAEIAQCLPRAYYSVHGPGKYYDDFPGKLPHDVLGSTSYCLGLDQLLSTGMEVLYRWRPMRQFIADITSNRQIYLHEDPSNALIVQVYEPGCEIGWHFDQTLFTSIINLSEPTAGGLFECVPDLRTEQDPRYDEVREVLYDRSARVRRYRVGVGSLMLMYGRRTFHRVTRIEPGTPRTSLVLTYELQPGVHLDAAARKRIFGPSAPDEPAL